MANKYLDLIGLANYHKGLLNTFTTDVTYDSTNGFRYNKYPNAIVDAAGAVTKGTAVPTSIVSLDTLRTDLGLSDAVNDVSAGSGTGELSVTKNGTASTVTIPGMATQSGEVGSKTSTATEDQIVLGSDTRLNGAIQSVKVNGSALTPDANKAVDITSIPATIVAVGAFADGMTATTQAQGDGSEKLATTAYVDTAVSELPQAMIFRGTLGTGGTITSLPTADASTVGDVYKVIEAGSYASQSAEIGDLFICAQGGTVESPTYSWELIPSGDVPSGTVTSVGITSSGDGAAAITVSDSPVTSSGNITLTVNPATTSTFGVVQVGTNINVASGVISVATANGTSLGLAKQGTNVTVDNTGAINVATGDASTLGVVSPDNTSITATNGVLTVDTITYTSGGDIDALFG